MFHSVRRTLATSLVLAGVEKETVKRLMRHSDVRLTDRVYVDKGQLPAENAADHLPIDAWLKGLSGSSVATGASKSGPESGVSKWTQKGTTFGGPARSSMVAAAHTCTPTKTQNGSEKPSHSELSTGISAEIEEREESSGKGTVFVRTLTVCPS